MQKIVIVFLIFICSLVNNQRVEGAARIYVPVQFVVVNGDFNESMVYLRREGETVASFRGQKNLRLRLDYDSEYTIDFTKPGYITKTIRVNTRVEADRKKYGFDPYKIGVRLFKQYEGVNTVVYNQPVASIRYLAEMDEFGYDTDYTKSILSALSRAEEILEQRAKEEMEEMKAREIKKREELKTRKPMEEEMVKRAVPVKTEEVKPINQGPAIVSFSDKDTVSVSSVSVEGMGGKFLKTPASGTSGEEASGGLDNAGADDKPAIGGGDDGRETQHIAIIETSGSEQVPIEHHSQANTDREIQEIVEQNRTITVFRIKNGEHIEEFKNIKYNWGGMFYFMNDFTPISEHLFNYMTSRPLSR